MKFKHLECLGLLALLAGCAQLQVASRPKTIGGETCMESPKLQVFQAIDDGILAHLCPVDIPSYYNDQWEYCSHGDIVFMPVDRKANDYVDEQKVTLPKNQCFVGDGKFKYTTPSGMERTVRKIKIAEEPRPIKNKTK